jgi:threonine-phosphate decarboxylase
VAEGWVTATAERHHGAHSAFAAASLCLSRDSFLDLSQNINPLGPPPGALEAARRAISSSTTYPDAGYADLRRALGRYLGVGPDHVLPTNGGAEALFLAALGLARSGSRRAVILEPTFSEYAAAARAAGMEAVRRVGWREDGSRFSLDRDAAADIESGDVVFLCNPNNPTGNALPRDEVLGVAEAVRRASATLVLDEAFADFAPEVSVAGETGVSLVVARSFTKFFGVPGLRLGCLISPEAAVYGSLQPSWAVNVAAEAAGISAASNAEFAGRAVDLVRDLRHELHAALSELPELLVYEGAANFLLVRGPARMPSRLARRGVLVRGCEPFEGLCPEHFRVAVSGREDNRTLVEALRSELASPA